MTGQEFRDITDRLIGQAHETLNQFIGNIHEIQHSGFEVAEENERMVQELIEKNNEIETLRNQINELQNRILQAADPQVIPHPQTLEPEVEEGPTF